MKAQGPNTPLTIFQTCLLHNHIPDGDKDVTSPCEWEVFKGDFHLEAGMSDDA